MKIPDFTRTEIEYFIDNCNFTKDELTFFNYRNEENTLDEIAELMDYSLSTIKRINRRVKNKIIRVL